MVVILIHCLSYIANGQKTTFWLLTQKLLWSRVFVWQNCFWTDYAWRIIFSFQCGGWANFRRVHLLPGRTSGGASRKSGAGQVPGWLPLCVGAFESSYRWRRQVLYAAHPYHQIFHPSVPVWWVGFIVGIHRLKSCEKMNWYGNCIKLRPVKNQVLEGTNLINNDCNDNTAMITPLTIFYLYVDHLQKGLVLCVWRR